MATLTKVYLQFSEKFWGKKETYFTPSNSSDYECDAAPLIYSLDGEEALEGSKIVAIALTGERGKEAANIETSNDNTRDWVCQEFVPVLNNHFEGGINKKFGRELTCDDIINIFIPTWINDPLSLGCWLVSPLGSAGKIEYEWPVMGNLILSGEGTCERHTGWVPGGYFSGERSTKLMLKERMEGFEDLDTRTLCDHKASKHFDFNKETCHFDLKQE
jgi:monoamine oxidase